MKILLLNLKDLVINKQMEFEKQQRAANRGEGYYGHKDYKGGFAGNVTQKGPGRSKDDRMADGGLIDLYRYGGFSG